MEYYVMQVRQAVLEAIAAHARRERPRECCGLLIGTDVEITGAVPAGNVADDPERRYEIAPMDHFAAIRRCREAARDGSAVRVIGGYHSHPHGAPVPSPTDLELAFEEFVYLIAGPVADGVPCGIRAYRLRDGAFEALRLTCA